MSRQILRPRPDAGHQGRAPTAGPSVSQRDVDSSCHRLSRVPQRYLSNKSVERERRQSFVTAYFHSHPDDLDTRHPREKITSIDERLQNENLAPAERHCLLARKKQLICFVHGESSVEMLRVARDLGVHYNQMTRPVSALRHLAAARALAAEYQIGPEEGVVIAIEMAHAHVALAMSHKDAQTNLNAAHEALQQTADTPIGNPNLRLRRDIALARVARYRGRFQRAIQLYKAAIGAMPQPTAEEKVAVAVMYVEMGRAAEGAKRPRVAAAAYKKAVAMYTELGRNDEAAAITKRMQDEQDRLDVPDAGKDDLAKEQTTENTATEELPPTLVDAPDADDNDGGPAQQE